MNDPLSQLEQELKKLTPQAPSTDFLRNVEAGLGIQANLAVSKTKSFKLLSFSSIHRQIAATIVFLIGILTTGLLLQQKASNQIAKSSIYENTLEKSVEGDPTINSNNWHPTDKETILVDISNEGIIHSPYNPPFQLYRYKYMDTTTFTDPTDHSKMQLVIPREQVVQIKLEPY